MGRDDAALEGDLQSTGLRVGRIGGVVACADGVDGNDEPIRATDDPGVVCAVREGDVCEAGEEDDESGMDKFQLVSRVCQLDFRK